MHGSLHGRSRMMVDNCGGIWLVEAGTKMGFSNGKAHCVGKALAQRSCTTKHGSSTAQQQYRNPVYLQVGLIWNLTKGVSCSRGTCGDLNAVCDEVLWVAWRVAAPLPEVLAILKLQIRLQLGRFFREPV